MQYLEADPGLPGRIVRLNSFRSYNSEVTLTARLHEFGLLPEVHRLEFLTAVREAAIRGDDLQVLEDDEINGLFTAEEFESLSEDIRQQLFPVLAQVRENWELGFDPDDDPAEQHMQRLLDKFELLSNKYESDEEAVIILSRETKLARNWIASYTRDEPTKPERVLGEVDIVDEPSGERSIFDDIDV